MLNSFIVGIAKISTGGILSYISVFPQFCSLTCMCKTWNTKGTNPQYLDIYSVVSLT